MSALQQTILIVEDDPALRVLLGRRLQEHGFKTVPAQSAPEAWRALGEHPVDLVLLDIMLPGTNGLDICRTIRRDNNVPIIILSARADETDRVLGLELGADDYVPKPFSTKELIARIRAVLRRRQPDWLQPNEAQGLLRFAGWTLDVHKHELLSPQGVRVELSGAEYGLLVVLLDNAQRVIGRERLLELSRTRLGDSSDRSIDVLVSRLRRKLSQQVGGDSLIRTMRGTGYMLTATVERL
ncbi:MAG: response regulator transcription factor [Candidatus Andeanibacterium colombiense]|uniref:Regulatory protein VirG n=1 Tax=Candidatus Andeanibacterium colombiense TaxID=3121345 RepID=A0AAJ5XCJ1_9SPHN|nr:MAG: response regulator transcription factor [Sphingomonadaceae bacterium]